MHGEPNANDMIDNHQTRDKQFWRFDNLYIRNKSQLVVLGDMMAKFYKYFNTNNFVFSIDQNALPCVVNVKDKRLVQHPI